MTKSHVSHGLGDAVTGHADKGNIARDGVPKRAHVVVPAYGMTRRQLDGIAMGHANATAPDANPASPITKEPQGKAFIGKPVAVSPGMRSRTSQHDTALGTAILASARARANAMAASRNIQDGEWVAPQMSGYRMECCRCGLVHVLDFRVTPHIVDLKCAATPKRKRSNDNAPSCFGKSLPHAADSPAPNRKPSRKRRATRQRRCQVQRQCVAHQESRGKGDARSIGRVRRNHWEVASYEQAETEKAEAQHGAARKGCRL